LRQVGTEGQDKTRKTSKMRDVLNNGPPRPLPTSGMIRGRQGMLGPSEELVHTIFVGKKMVEENVHGDQKPGITPANKRK